MACGGDRLIESIGIWFTENLQTILYVLAALGLALLAWKTSFGKMLVNAMAAIVKMRGVLIALAVIAVVALVAGGWL